MKATIQCLSQREKLLAILLCIALIMPASFFAQCPNTTLQTFTVLPTCDGATQTIASDILGGQSALVTTIPGNVYIFSTCGTAGYDTHISVYDGLDIIGTPANLLGDNDDFCGSQSQVTITATTIATNVVVYQSPGCTPNATTGIDLTVTCCPLPNAICQNVTVNLNGNGVATVDPNSIVGSLGPCFNSSINGQSSFSCADVGTPSSVTVTVTNLLGLTSSCNATISVQDVTPPTLTCADTTIELDGSGNATLNVNNVAAATDACGLAGPITASVGTFNCADIGALSTTLSVADPFGLASTCTITVNIEDTSPPTLTCSDITIELDETGNATLDVNAVAAATDNCSLGGALMVTTSAFDCTSLGQNTVTISVPDVVGLSSSCDITVTVTDPISPTLTCQDINIELDGNGMGAIANVNQVSAVTDNCPLGGPITLSVSTFDCTDIGPNTITASVLDALGISFTCDITVTVTDPISPTLTCQNINVELNGNGMGAIANVGAVVAATDNCPLGAISLSASTFDCTDIGPNTVTVSVLDALGITSTCEITVTVTDPISPTLTCQDINVSLDGNGMGSIANVGAAVAATDNCPLGPISLSVTTFDCTDLGPNTVTVSVLDALGITSTCEITVTVTDPVSPTLTCTDINVTLDGNGMGSIANVAAVIAATDNCPLGNISLSATTFDCTDVGPNTITVSVLDALGIPFTCDITVTVIDPISPTLTCQNIDVTLDGNGMGSIANVGAVVAATDNCPLGNISLNVSTFDCTDVGPNTVTVSVLDALGITFTCDITVTVIDPTSPSLTCQDITVELDGNGMGQILDVTAAVAVTDNCPIPGIFLSATTFDCTDIGPNTITVSVPNALGVTFTCDITVTVTDPISPTLTCSNINVTLDGNGMGAIADVGLVVSATDNCPLGNISLSVTTFDCTDLGPNTVTVSVLDALGITSTCEITVTVIDPISPTLTCSNINVTLDGNGMGAIADVDLVVSATDNCPLGNISLSATTFDCTDVGPNTITVSVLDALGITFTCDITVTVIDPISPTLTCSNIDVTLDGNGMGQILDVTTVVSATDNCPLGNISLNVSTFDCTDVGPNTVTVSVLDALGITFTCDITVTVIDPTSPSLTCQDITIELDGNGMGQILDVTTVIAATDNCPIPGIFLSATTFDCTDIGPNTISVSVPNALGVTFTCDLTVTVTDPISPTLTCTDINVTLDGNGMGAIADVGLVVSATDNCPLGNISLDITTFDCTDIGPNTVTVSVLDALGITFTCDITVTVIDPISPTLTCSNIDVTLDGNGMGAIADVGLVVSATDNCPLGNISLDVSTFDCTDIGPNTVTVSVLDALGITFTCDITVTVIDPTSPSLTCQDITIELDGNGMGEILDVNTVFAVTDNCPIPGVTLSVTTFDCTDIGPNTVSVSVLNALGVTFTCDITVTVTDPISPTLTCSNINVTLDGNGMGAIADVGLVVSATDNCPLGNISLDVTTFDCTDIGPNTVTVSVLDALGITFTCDITVTVTDPISPTLTCSNINVTLDGNGMGEIADVGLVVSATDNCPLGNISLDVTTFDCTDIGPNTVTVSVLDALGITFTCDITVTVTDPISPTLTCSNINVTLDGNGMGEIADVGLVVSATDNCPLGNISLDVTTFDCTDIGPNTVTVSVLDALGITFTCDITVTVIDPISPNLTCQDITIELGSNGTGSITDVDLVVAATDNCPLGPITLSTDIFDCADVGSNTITVTIPDVLGISFTCDITVTVVDPISPTLTCVNTSVTLDNTGNATVDVNAVAAATDACGLVGAVTLSSTLFNCADVGQNTVTASISDINGNTATCTATVTVLTAGAPTLTCVDATVTLDASGNGTIDVNAVASATDACGIANSISVIPNSFTCVDVGTVSATFTVTNTAGLTATCSATITVEDVTPPTITCNDSTVQLDASGNATVNVNTIAAASDACGINSFDLNQNTFTCADIGQVTVTATATDANGNTATCDATLTIEDTISPTITCNNLTVQLDITGNVTVLIGDVAAASDACGILGVISLSETAFDCNDAGTNTVIASVSDVNGNTATCSAVITVQATTPPTITCNNLTVQLDASGNATLDVDAIASATDACGIAGMVVLVPNSVDCSDVGQITATATVTSTSGLTATCDATITVEDNISPTLTCNSTTIQLDANGNASIVAADVSTAADACGLMGSVVLSANTFNCSDVGTTSITASVSDVNGNTATCMATLTIEDNISPTLTCTDVTIQLDNTGNATISVGMVAAATDACGLSGSIVLSNTAFDCDDTGANSITASISDVNGNTATCVATVTVQATTPPTIICNNLTVQLDASGNATLDVDAIAAATDVCGIAGMVVLVPNSVDCSDVGQITATATVTSTSGLTATCNATITVEDNISPTLTCNSATVELDANGDGSIVTGDVAVADDACGLNGMIAISSNTFDCSNVGQVTVTATVSDINGNTATCDATVTVEDNISPTLTCNPTTVELDANGDGSLVAGAIAVASDACGLNGMIAISRNTFDCSDVGEVTVTASVSDVNGNTAICDATVTVQTANAPTLTCVDASANVVVELDASGNATIDFNTVAAATDVCGILSTMVMNNGAFDCSNVGQNTVTVSVSAINTSGFSASCNATITIQDNISPTLTCNPTTVQLDANGNGGISVSDIAAATDACGLNGMIAISANSFTCVNVGQVIVTATVSDVNGNTATCDATVTVEDNVSPTLTCNSTTVQLDSNGNGSIVAADVATADDACGLNGMIALNISSFTCVNVGQVTVTASVSDVNGNTATCDATVTVEDNVSPTLTCNSTTVQLDSNGNGSIVATDVATADDACGLDGMITINQTSFTCADVGQVTVTAAVSDLNGNTATCSATVTVEDNISPTLTCNSTTVQLDSNGNGSIIAGDVATADDACGLNGMIAISAASFTCADVGQVTVTATVSDVNGNTATCDATVTVEDNISPTLTCNPIAVELNGNGDGSITAADIATADDACGTNMITLSNSTFDCSDVGQLTVTASVSDVNGNTAICDATVTVHAASAPTLTCASAASNLIVELDASGSVTVDFNTIASVTDVCSVSSVNLLSNNLFTCADVGANTILVSVENSSGLSATCTASFTIADTTAPTITCNATTVQLDTNGDGSIVAADIATADDVCGISGTIILSASSFACADVGQVTVTATVSDVNGNTANCDATVTVEDNISPTLTCNPIAVELDGNGNGSITAADIATAADACGTNMITLSNSTFDCSDVGQLTVTASVSDVNGNTAICDATVTVHAASAPTLTCVSAASNLIVELDASGSVTVDFNTIASVTDVCSVSSVNLLSNNLFTCADVGANTILVSVENSSGLSATCTASFTIADTTAPTITCNATTVQLDANGDGSIVAADIATADDACGVDMIMLSVNSFDCTDVGANTVVASVSDVNGNTATCSATVTVEDNVSPEIFCTNTTVQLDANGDGSIVAADISLAADACGVGIIMLSANTFTCTNVGNNIIVASVSDLNGNTATCNATVTVEDNISPTLTCNPTTVQLDANGDGSIVAADIATATDACGVGTIMLSANTFGCTNVGANTVVTSVSDVNGNTATCSATVTVVDNTNPVITCTNITIQLDDTGNATIAPADVASANDACGTNTITLSNSTFGCADVPSSTVVATVTDANGNTATCTAMVTVQDVTPPVLVCQDITVELDANGMVTVFDADVIVSATDACGVIGFSGFAPVTYTCANVGPNMFTAVVFDVFGNSGTCDVICTVNDNFPPTVVTQPATVILDANGNGMITAADIDGGSSDACGIANLSASMTNFDCSNVGTNQVTLTVTDVNGNTATGMAPVMVIDQTPPNITCQDFTLSLDATGMGILNVGDILVTSADACGIASSSVDVTNFNCGNFGSNPVVVTVTDVNGNTSTCSQSVTVQDVTPPNALCVPGLSLNLDVNNMATITAAQIDNGSTDECGAVTLSVDPSVFGIPNIGLNNVTLTVTDGSGNTSTCNSLVTIIDNAPPNALCQNTTISLDENGVASITAADIDNGSNDASGPVTISVSQTDFDCDDLGDNTVILTVTDLNGNQATCSATVTVLDGVPAVIACRPTIHTATGPGTDLCGIEDLIMLPPFIFEENCGVGDITNDAPALFPVGTTIVTWSITDNGGNVSTCEQPVIIQDGTAPVIECANSFIAYTTEDQCTYPSYLINDPEVFDNCGIESIVNDAPAEFGPGNYMVMYKATDFSGNFAMCMVWVKVIDLIGPEVVSCPPNMEVEATETDGSAQAFFPTAVAVDNCGPLYSTESDFDSGDFFPLGDTEVTFTFIDNFGNQEHCSFTVSVVPQNTFFLDLACVEDIDISSPNDIEVENITWNDPLMDENCNNCPIQESDEFEYIGSLAGHQYYRYKGEYLTWAEAKVYAEWKGGYLAVIDNEKEMAMWMNEIGNNNYMTGLVDTAGTGDLTWVNGATLNEAVFDMIESDSITPMTMILSIEDEWKLIPLEEGFGHFIFEVPCVDMAMDVNIFNEDGEPVEQDTMLSENQTAVVTYTIENACGETTSCEFEMAVSSETVEYCNISGIATDEDNPYFIQSMSIGETFIESGYTAGYMNYDLENFEFKAGETVSFAAELNNPTGKPLYCRMWMDFNNDGDFFDEGEMVGQGVETEMMEMEWDVPLNPVVETRMRIAVARMTYPDACGDFLDGEVEDYTFSIKLEESGNDVDFFINHDTGITTTQGVSISPNPTQGIIDVEFETEIESGTLKVYNEIGEFIFELELSSGIQSRVDLSDKLTNGIYALLFITDKETLPAKRLIIAK